MRIFGVEVQHNVLDQAATANAYWLRENALMWSEVQPDSPSDYIWSSQSDLENELIQASQNGLETILIIRSTPTWAHLDPPLNKFCGPVRQDRLSDFAGFVQAAVERYSQPPFNVSYYEIWNEPDVSTVNQTSDATYGCWGDFNDTYFGGGYYAEMLKDVYPALKSADPEAQLVLGGLLLDCDPNHTGNDTGGCLPGRDIQPRFFEGVLQNDGGNYFDIISFHAYAYYVQGYNPIQTERLHPRWSATGGVVDGKLNFLSDLMSQYGISKPIIQSESALLSSYSSPPPEFETAKAEYLVWLFVRNWSRGLIGTAWYTIDNPGWRFSSLLDSNQEPLAAYSAMQVLSTALNGADYQSRDIYSPDVERFIFTSGQNTIWVLIPSDTATHSITPPAGLVSAEDMLGNPLSLTGSISYKAPIYLTFEN